MSEAASSGAGAPAAGSQSGSTESTSTQVQSLASGAPDQGTQGVPGETAAEAVARRFKVKVDNQEIDVDEGELIKGYQLNKSSQKRFHEASQMRQQAEELINLARSNPRALLTHPSISHDLKQFAEEILAEQIEEQMMSPAEKEHRDMKKRLEQFETEKKTKEQQLQAEKDQQLYEHYQQDYSDKIVNALGTSGLPKTEHTVKRMAYYMLQAHELGYDASPADVVELVRKDYLSDIQSLFGASNEDLLLQMLGEETANKVVKGHLNKVKKAPGQFKQPVEQPQPGAKKPAPAARKPMSRDEWKAMLDERTGKR